MLAAAGPREAAVTLPLTPRLGGLARRFATSLVAIPVFAWIAVGAPAWLFALLVVVAGTLALAELVRLFEQGGHAVPGRLATALGAALLVAFALAGAPGAALVPTLPAVVLTVAVGALLASPIQSGRVATEPVALGVLAVVYVGWFLGHAALLHRLEDGPALVLVLVGVTWVGETAAYAVGSLAGRRPLAPVLSPRKTVEGALAQLVASVLTALALGPAWLLPEWDLAFAAGAGALLGVVAQVGDLAESAIKRSAGVKDAGSLIPGHGGVLDRIDGLLFGVPAFYYYVRLGGAA